VLYSSDRFGVTLQCCGPRQFERGLKAMAACGRWPDYPVEGGLHVFATKRGLNGPNEDRAVPSRR
jgi:hypothetical protein